MQPGPKVLAYFLGNENLPITDTLLVSWLAVILLIIFAALVKRRLKIAWPAAGRDRDFIDIYCRAD